MKFLVQALFFLTVLHVVMAQDQGTPDGPAPDPYPWMSAFDFSIIEDDIPTPIETRPPGNKPDFIEEVPP